MSSMHARAAATATATVTEVGADAGKQRVYNGVIGLVHLAQGVAMPALSNDSSPPVTRSFLTGPPGADPTQEPWFEVALFLFLAALDHLLIAAPGLNRWHNGMIPSERKDARWIEYSVRASIMITLIALITGVSDIGALVAIAGVDACMLFFRLVQSGSVSRARGT